MPQNNNWFLNDPAYGAASKVFTWQDIGASSYVTFSVHCSVTANVLVEYAVDSTHTVILSENTPVTAGVLLELTLPIKSQFLRVSVNTIASNPCTLACQSFFFEDGSFPPLDNEGSGAEVLDTTTRKLRTLYSSDLSVTISEVGDQIDFTAGLPVADSLSSVLSVGNTSGGTDIDLTAGSELTSTDGDINIKNFNPAFQTLIDGNFEALGNSTISRLVNNSVLTNADHITVIGKEAYYINSYLPIANSGFVNGAMTAGIDTVSCPTIVYSGGLWVAGDIVLLSSCQKSRNNGLYEVLSVGGGTMQLRGVSAGDPTTYNFFKQNLTTDTSGVNTQILTQVNVSILRCNTSGVWQLSNTASNAASLTWMDIQNTLQSQGTGSSILGSSNSLGNPWCKTILAGSGCSVSIASNDVVITNTSLNTSVTLSSAGGTETLVVDAVGPSLSTKGLTGSTSITLTAAANDITLSTASSSFYGFVRMTSNSNSGRSFSFPVYASASEILPASASYTSTLSNFTASNCSLTYTGVTTRTFLVQFMYSAITAAIMLGQLHKNGTLITGSDYYSGDSYGLLGSVIVSLATSDVIAIYGGIDSAASKAVTAMYLLIRAL